MQAKNRRRHFAGLQPSQRFQHGNQAESIRTEIELEESEILRNARALRKAGEITDEDLNDTIYYTIARARAEREMSE